MKKIIALSCLLFTFSSQAQHPSSQVQFPKYATKDLKSVVWCGVDYSLTRFVGGDGFRFGFMVPDMFIPDMFENWNQLFIEERIENVANGLNRRVIMDRAGVVERNRSVTAHQVISTPSEKDASSEPQITIDAIANAIKSLTLTNSHGLGLVLLVDKLLYRPIPPVRYDAPPGTICLGVVHVVFFDLATRQIILHKKVMNRIGSSSNFRNFWFGPIKDAESVIVGQRGKLAKW